MSDEWRRMSAGELGRAIGAGRIDPRELAETFLDAMAAHPDSPRIYSHTTPGRAREQAAAAAGRARAGMRLGPLDGVPISWKDLFDIAGEPAEAGSKLLAGRVAERDCAVYSNAAAQGLVCLGKTHMSELAFSGLGVNPVAATPPNAYRPDCAPGGSSSGAAVSVALGLAAAGIGSDTGGSVRVPSAWNGLAGLKTTAGALPLEGVVPLAPTLDTVGPLCRTVEDCGMLFDILAGRVPVVPEPAALEGARFLVPQTVVLDGCEAQVREAFEAALEQLGAAGARLVRGPVPELAETVEVSRRLSAIVNTEGWRVWGETIEANPGVMYARIEERFRSGMDGTPETDRAALAEYARLSRSLGARMAESGPLIMPTVPILPPPVDRLLADKDYYVERNLLSLRNTRLGNLLGLSALTVPTRAPMVGLMIMAGPGEERRLVALGQAFERALG